MCRVLRTFLFLQKISSCLFSFPAAGPCGRLTMSFSHTASSQRLHLSNCSNSPCGFSLLGALKIGSQFAPATTCPISPKAEPASAQPLGGAKSQVSSRRCSQRCGGFTLKWVYFSSCQLLYFFFFKLVNLIFEI